MAIPPLDIPICGRPALLTDPSRVAEQWKCRVAEKVGNKWPHGYIEEPCAVQLAFDLQRARFGDTALFNLLKHTIDGLSHVIFAPSTFGKPSPWNRQDWRITELYAWKNIARMPGVRITVGPAVSGPHSIPRESIADDFVPGSPPLWAGPGSAALYECRRAYERVLQIARPVDPSILLRADLGFSIEPERTEISDLDNYCITAGQAVCYSVFGNLKRPHRLMELHATKSTTCANTEAGVQVRVCRV